MKAKKLVHYKIMFSTTFPAILSAITVIALAIYLFIENKKRVRFGLIVALIVWAGILAIAAFTQWGN